MPLPKSDTAAAACTVQETIVIDATNTECGCCEDLRLEVQTLKEEIEVLKLKFGAFTNHPPSGNMQIVDSLQRNNATLSLAVEALSKQILRENVTDSPVSTSDNKTNQSKQHATPAPNNHSDDSTQKKRRKKKRSGPAPGTNTNTNGRRDISAPVGAVSTEAPPSTSVPPTSTTLRKQTVVVAGDSLVKNIIGAKMSSSDKEHYYIVKPFPGATVTDMEDFIKPLTRKCPDKMILHVGTNDLKSTTARNIADSIINLVTQIKEDSPATSVGVSGLLLRTDNVELAHRAREVNSVLNAYCNRNRIAFFHNTNICAEHLNMKGLHLNKQGTTLLQENFRQFAKVIVFN